MAKPKTVKVKLLTSRAGVGFAQSRGDVIDVPVAEAKRMQDAGQCTLVRDEPPETTAGASAAETAVAGAGD